MYYMYIDKEFDRIGFKVEGEHDITEDDFPISEENYNRFFELQEQGISLRVKDIHAEKFEDIFEEFVPEIPKDVIEEESEVEALKNKVNRLEQVLNDLINTNISEVEG